MSRDTYFEQTIALIVSALQERGYSPHDQLKGYLEENDPTYITRFKNARELIATLDKKDIYRYLRKM